MSALLVILLAIGAILALFVRGVRGRAARSLQQSGHALPPELQQQVAALRVAGAPAAKAAAAVVARAAVPPLPRIPAPGAPHFMLVYDVGPDFIQRRAQHRDEHLALAWQAAAAGELLLAGALEEPTEQAFLLFRGSREAAMRFAQADPYVRHGLVRQWRVRQWNTVVGEMAAAPLRPAAQASAAVVTRGNLQ